MGCYNDMDMLVVGMKGKALIDIDEFKETVSMLPILSLVLAVQHNNFDAVFREISLIQFNKRHSLSWCFRQIISYNIIA